MINELQEFDLVSVTIKNVEFYGNIVKIDWDLRSPCVIVEFFPGCEREFGFDEITLVNFPEKK